MNNRILPTILIICLVIGGVAAAWVFQYDNSVGGEVMATGNKLDVIFDLADYEINASEGIVNHTQNLSFNNKKQNQTMYLILETNKTLTEPSCPNWQNDCAVTLLSSSGMGLVNGSSMLVTKGINDYYLTTICVEDSCGQNLSTRVYIHQ